MSSNEEEETDIGNFDSEALLASAGAGDELPEAENSDHSVNDQVIDDASNENNASSDCESNVSVAEGEEIEVEEQEIEEKEKEEEGQVSEPEKHAFNVAKDSSPQPSATNQVQSSVLQEMPESSDIDFESISSFLTIDTDSIKSIDPEILQKLQTRSNDIAALKSDKLVLEVNLEQATHLGNKRVDLVKSQLKKAQRENSELKEKSASLETSTVELRNKLSKLEAQLKSKSSIDESNQSKLDEVQVEKRKTVELLEKKNAEIELLKTEYNDIQVSNSKLRKQLIELETSNQTANSNVVQLKLKVQSLEPQIDLLKSNNNWLNNELKTINVEFSEYRRQKSAELSTLQYAFDANTEELNALRLRHDELNSRFEDVSAKLENSLLEVKKLTDEKALNQEEFFNEISVKDRLTTLLKQSNSDLKAKTEQLEAQLTIARSEVAHGSAGLQTTLDSYKEKLEQSEAKIQQLEKTVDELSRSTPSANSSLFSTLSPSTEASVTANSHGISLSQLYSDFTLVKRQLVQERRAKERMQHQIDSFVSELERKAPLINATKERATILEKELTHLSVILENTVKEKEELEKSKEDLSTDLQEAQSQIGALNKQRVDLARQVQTLLVQITIRGDSNGPLTPAEKHALDRIANGDKVLNESDTDQLISDRLVVFQNVVELQKKNEELLRITRELGQKLEKQEKHSRSRLEDLESAAVSEAKEAILTLTDEIKSIETKLNSVTRERDMFRSMLANKGSDNILTGELNRVAASDEVVEVMRKYEDAQNELSSLQRHFDQFKVESNTTIQMLNKQIDSLSREKSDLAVNLAREKSSATLVQERYNSLQENIKMMKSETDELRKRTQFLQENNAKQDMRTQMVAEELLQSNTLIESLRSETSNLKAEKQIWKSIEKRLTEENASLIEEKAKLNALLMNVQLLEKERQSNSGESQKRLIMQTESLEKELSTLREKLASSSDELKDVLTKKESDSHAYQTRIDSLRVELSTTREELIVKRTTCETLEEKVQSLSEKLALSESRLSEYQNIAASAGSQSALVAESIRLRTELEEAKVELEEANNTAEKFKSIAASAEESLSSINTSFDRYKEDTANSISKLESEKKSLEQTIAMLKEQIESFNNELATSREEAKKQADLARREIESLGAQLEQASRAKADYDAKTSILEDSYQQQVAIASEAQKNYEREMQKHVEVSKAVSSLREESNNFKIQLQQSLLEAKAAKDELRNSQESWEAQKSKLEEELRIATSRVEDLTSQNHILYNQIDNMSNKISDGGQTFVNDEASEGSDAQLRELINLLRREKEISDTQLDVASRDLKRVRQQLEVVTSELDQARVELVKLQSHDVDVEKLTKEHKNLLNEIQQLNLLRESNTTLRNELHLNVAKVKELESKLTSSELRVQPLETQIVQLNAEIMHKDQEIKLVVEERDRWKQRSQDILSKYDRIDPEEHEKQKKELEEAKREVAATKKELEDTKTEMQASIESLTSRLDKLREEAQDKLRRRGEEKKQIQSQLNESIAELKKVKEDSEAEISRLRTEIKDLQSKIAASSSESNSSNNSLKKELQTLKKELKDVTANLKEAQQFESQLKAANSQISEDKAKIASLEKEIAELKSQLEKAQLEKAESESKSSTAVVSDSEVSKLKEELEKEKSELTKSKESFDLEKAAFEKAKTDTSAGQDSGVDADATEKALKDQEAKLRAEFEAEKASALEDLKNKIRAPSQQKLEALTLKRTADLKHSLDECKLKLEEVTKSSTKVNEELKAQAFKEGRDATLRETNMRSKLLQGKIDKLTKEKQALEAKLNSLTKKPNGNPAADSSPVKIDATPINGSSERRFEIPPKPVLSKPAEETPVATSTATPVAAVTTPIDAAAAESSGTKRPAEKTDVEGSPEKKSKSEA